MLRHMDTLLPENGSPSLADLLNGGKARGYREVPARTGRRESEGVQKGKRSPAFPYCRTSPWCTRLERLASPWLAIGHARPPGRSTRSSGSLTERCDA